MSHPTHLWKLKHCSHWGREYAMAPKVVGSEDGDRSGPKDRKVQLDRRKYSLVL